MILCVASQPVFVAVVIDFLIDSVRKLLVTQSYLIQIHSRQELFVNLQYKTTENLIVTES
jgi:hypothetical protein